MDYDDSSRVVVSGFIQEKESLITSVRLNTYDHNNNNDTVI